MKQKSLFPLYIISSFLICNFYCSQNDSSYTTKLLIKDGIKGLVAPVVIPLKSEPDENLILPEFNSLTPLYGSFKLGNSKDSIFSFAIDEIQGKEVIIIDLNNDNNLTNDSSLSWIGKYKKLDSGRIQLPNLEICIKYKIIQNNSIKDNIIKLRFGRNSREESLKVFSFKFLKYSQAANFYNNSYRTGKIQLSEKQYKIAIQDVDGNGIYNDSTDAFIIDINQDSKLDWNYDSPEYYLQNNLFNIDNVTYEISYVTPSGHELGIKKSNRYVSPKGILEKGQIAPAFKSKDIYGNEVSVNDNTSEYILLDFWATWCGPCVAEIPYQKEAYNKYNEKNFEIIGINYDNDLELLKKFIKDKEISWKQISDFPFDSGPIATQYRVLALPTTYLVDKKGKILAKNIRGSN